MMTMARMYIDTEAQDRARHNLAQATKRYAARLRAVEDARRDQRIAIIEAWLEEVTIPDISEMTQTPDRPRGFTREHVRRITDSYRDRLDWGRYQGLPVDEMSIAEVLDIELPRTTMRRGGVLTVGGQVIESKPLAASAR